MRHIACVLAAGLVLTAYGCSEPPQAASQNTTSTAVLQAREGLATYYARRFDGNVTASGIRFDNDAMVAAHPTYPFGTVVRVTNLRNRQSVRVRIVDRGPARAARSDGVVIDLSRAAARALGFLSDGRTRVRLEVLRWGKSSDDLTSTKQSHDDQNQDDDEQRVNEIPASWNHRNSCGPKVTQKPQYQQDGNQKLEHGTLLFGSTPRRGQSSANINYIRCFEKAAARKQAVKSRRNPGPGSSSDNRRNRRATGAESAEEEAGICA